MKNRYHPLMRASRQFKHGTLVFLVVVALLTLGFYRNQWHAAGAKWFYDWKNNSDVMLVARLVWSRQQGILADSALLGLGDGQWPMTAELGRHQYETYFAGGTFDRYWTYQSVIGAQGIIFSALDRVTRLPGNLSLKLFRGMSALLSAVTIALIVSWFHLEWGILPAFLVLAFSMLSEWFALYGSSVYWQFWALFLPGLAVGAWLHQARKTGWNPFPVLVLISACAVLIKTAFNGFEFITTVLGMMFIPVVFQALDAQWTWKGFLIIVAQVGTGAAAGTLLGLGILTAQIATVEHGWKPAIQYIAYTLGKRAAGDPGQYLGPIADSLRAQTWTVIWKYVGEGRAMDLGNWLAGPQFSGIREKLEIPFSAIFLLFIFASLLFLLYARTGRHLAEHRKTRILLYLTWVSILPPLSWLILFKAHAYIHTNLDYIVWQMPFALFGFAFCGMLIRYFWSLRVARKPA